MHGHRILEHYSDAALWGRAGPTGQDKVWVGRDCPGVPSGQESVGQLSFNLFSTQLLTSSIRISISLSLWGWIWLAGLISLDLTLSVDFN